MLTLRINDVPPYLRPGSFYECLDAQDNEAFEVPEECFKEDTSVTSYHELECLLQTVRFWGLYIVPVEVCEYILDYGDCKDYERHLSMLPELANHLAKVLEVKEASDLDRIKTAICANLGFFTVHMLRGKGYAWNEAACESAARMDDLACLMYLHTEGCPWNEKVIEAAAESKGVLCLKYLLDLGEFDAAENSLALSAAATKGNVEGMRMLRAYEAPWHDGVVAAAALGGHLESVQFLHAQACPLLFGFGHYCYWVMFCGDRNGGNVGILRYLHEELEWSLFFTAEEAARRGNLACLEYAHQHEQAWNVNVCMWAARGGHLHCLRFAREHGCPWDYKTLTAALSSGSWECLKYALWRGCFWREHIGLVFFMCFMVCFFQTPIAPDSVIYSLSWWSTVVGILLCPALFLLSFNKQCLAQYLTPRNVDRLVQSYICLMSMYLFSHRIVDAEWPMILLRSFVVVVLAGCLVVCNIAHVWIKVRIPD